VRFDRIIQKRIRRGDGSVRVDLDVNARIAANIDRTSRSTPAGGTSSGADEQRGESHDGRVQEAQS
jgi:hypothetical protein